MGDVFDELSAQSGFPADQLRYLVCLIALVPLSIPFRMLPSAALKHLYSIVLGIALCHFTLGAWSWLHSLATSTVCYAIMVVVPHGYAHLLVFGFMLTHLSVSHIYRMWTDWMGWSMDFTGPQMVLVIKMTMIAYNYYDGKRKASELKRPYQQEHKIGRLPNLLEFYGYVYFFPSFLAGPAYEISDYLALTDGSLFKGDKEARDKIPIMAIVKVYMRALAVMPVVLASTMLVPLSYLHSAAFAASPYWEKIMRMWFHIAAARWKYFMAWYLAEGGFVACGAGYNGKDKQGNRLWDRATNSYPLRVEFAENIRQAVESWNITTQTWLKYYVYSRIMDAGYTDGKAALMTYTISAFWHGFYPGYYMMFIFTGVLTEIAKNVRRKIRPRFMKVDGVTPIQPAKMVYDVVGTLATALIMNYAGVSFLFLALDTSVAMYNQLYWIGHILAFLVGLALQFMRMPKNQPPRRTA